MAKISKAPAGFEFPKAGPYLDAYMKKNKEKRGFIHKKVIDAIDQYAEDCEAIVTRLKQTLKDSHTYPEAGEEIRLPIASGTEEIRHARYLVASLKPAHLIHVGIDNHDWRFEGYSEFPYAHRLTTADIRDEIKKQMLRMGLEKLTPKFSKAIKIKE